MRTRFESLSRLLNGDAKAKTMLGVLECDWPTALQVVPAAFRVEQEMTSDPDCRDVLTRSLRSYQAALGKPDRDRLVAFMGTFLDGLAELLEQSPAPTAALLEMHKRLLSEVEKTKGAAVRDRLEALLLPPDTSIGVVWRSIQEHRNG